MTRDQIASLLELYTDIVEGYLEIAVRDHENGRHEQVGLILKAMQNNLAKFNELELSKLYENTIG